MKLFQIEEPEGGPTDPSAPGAAIGIDTSGHAAAVAMSVGGNAVMLSDSDGSEIIIPVPAPGAGIAQWQELFDRARRRAERALTRPVTHAVIVLPPASGDAAAANIATAAEQAGLGVLRLAAASDLAAEMAPALAAAMLAEDLALRPDSEST